MVSCVRARRLVTVCLSPATAKCHGMMHSVLQQGDCVVSNSLTLDLTEYPDPHAEEEREREDLPYMR